MPVLEETATRTIAAAVAPSYFDMVAHKSTSVSIAGFVCRACRPVSRG
jgi:hypothetical protein